MWFSRKYNSVEFENSSRIKKEKEIILTKNKSFCSNSLVNNLYNGLMLLHNYFEYFALLTWRAF